MIGVTSFLAISLRVAVRKSFECPLGFSNLFVDFGPVFKSPTTAHVRRFSKKDEDWKKMVDPKRVVSYEDVVKIVEQPDTMIIDVRNQEEVFETGKIPSSVNIPLGSIQQSLTMSDEEFQQQYKRPKPSTSDELVFYCRSGRRSVEALDKALQLGYCRSKTYLGSWIDWSTHKHS